MGIIFFLHQVLLDCSSLFSYDSKREWRKMVKGIPNLEPYENMAEALSELKESGFPICIISPFTPYLTSRILRHWDIIPFTSVVTYSDTSTQSQLLKSLTKAKAKIGFPSSHILVFCSTTAEIQAANTIKSISVHCGWNNQKEETLMLDATMQISDWSALSAITALFQHQSD